MAKKVKPKKKNGPNMKQTNKSFSDKQNNQKKTENTGKHKSAIFKNRNANIKGKNRKGKLKNKLSLVHNVKQNHTVMPDIYKNTNTINLKSIVKRKKEEIKQQSNKNKQKPNKKQTKHETKKTRNTNKTGKLQSLIKKKIKEKNHIAGNKSKERITDIKKPMNSQSLDITKLQELLTAKRKEKKREEKYAKPESLRERMMTKLKASRFRYLNETFYNSESWESKQYFKKDPDAFNAYHEGYKQQINQWPLNPLDIIISSIKKMPKDYIIADFGCGEAKLASSVPHKVHSFDFVALNENVTACDMAHTPLLTNGVHAVVFCLSLMGTNLKDYIIEANRVLKKDGVLKIAEVESRFEEVDDFIKTMNSYGFKNTLKDISHNLFCFLNFKKEEDIKSKKNKLPPIVLKPCLYKKR